MAKRLLIGGYALEKLGSTRQSYGLEYLTKDESTDAMYIHDKPKNTVYYNANGHGLFEEVWQMEKNNIGEIARPQALLELRAFDFVQHKQNGAWDKANEAEYDIKHLIGKYRLEDVAILAKYIESEEFESVIHLIKTMNR